MISSFTTDLVMLPNGHRPGMTRVKLRIIQYGVVREPCLHLRVGSIRGTTSNNLIGIITVEFPG